MDLVSRLAHAMRALVRPGERHVNNHASFNGDANTRGNAHTYAANERSVNSRKMATQQSGVKKASFRDIFLSRENQAYLHARYLASIRANRQMLPSDFKNRWIHWLQTWPVSHDPLGDSELYSSDSGYAVNKVDEELAAENERFLQHYKRIQITDFGGDVRYDESIMYDSTPHRSGGYLDTRMGSAPVYDSDRRGVVNRIPRGDQTLFLEALDQDAPYAPNSRVSGAVASAADTDSNTMHLRPEDPWMRSEEIASRNNIPARTAHNSRRFADYGPRRSAEPTDSTRHYAAGMPDAGDFVAPADRAAHATAGPRGEHGHEQVYERQAKQMSILAHARRVPAVVEPVTGEFHTRDPQTLTHEDMEAFPVEMQNHTETIRLGGGIRSARVRSAAAHRGVAAYTDASINANYDLGCVIRAKNL